MIEIALGLMTFLLGYFAYRDYEARESIKLINARLQIIEHNIGQLEDNVFE